MKKIIKGTSPLLFVIAFAAIILGAIIWGKSEQLSGWANVQKSQTLSVIGTCVFVAGVLVLIISYVVGQKRNSD